MKEKKWLWLVLIFTSGCAMAQAPGLSQAAFQNPLENYDRIEVLDSAVSYQRNQDVTASVFGNNERRWEPAALEVFRQPMEWLRNAAGLQNKIYLVKQVGRSMLFCLITPEAANYRKNRKSSAEYSVILIKTHDYEKNFNWPDFLRQRIGSYEEHRVVEVGPFQLIQPNWRGEHYWQSPFVYWQFGDAVYEMVLIYQGFSYAQANFIMHKFPWRVFTTKQ